MNGQEHSADVAEVWHPADGLIVRRATARDVTGIVAMLRDDELGAARETAPDEQYLAAFGKIDADPDQFLAVLVDAAESEPGKGILGTCQLTYTPGMSRGGSLRMTIESVRIDSSVRGRSLGRTMIGWALDHARERGADLVQLTTDKSRTSAHEFYRRLGFTASHEGMKLSL